MIGKVNVKNDIVKSSRKFLRDLMEKKIVDAIIVPLVLDSGRGAHPAFVTNTSMLDKANPFVPVMPVSTANEVKRITRLKPSDKKIAVVIRPCDLRNYIELIKFKQIDSSNIIIIGTDCYGVHDSELYKDMVDKGKDPFKDYMDLIISNKENNLRRACTTCKTPVPNKYADIIMGFFGTNKKDGILLISQTENGKNILDELKISDIGEVPEREKEVNKLIETRTKKWNEIKDKTLKEVRGIDNLLKYFDTCIDCHNCKDQCPICFCKECFWESPVFEFTPPDYFEWSEKKGAVRLPTDTLFFHLGRLAHMSTSCTGCGFCEDACPKNIELQRLFFAVGEETSKVFDYEPGRNLEEKPPLTTFREEELEEMGE